MRACFQVLVLPFTVLEDMPLFAIFERADNELPCWQGIAGGGEIGESPREAAVREAFEEAGIPPTSPWVELQSLTTIPVYHVGGFIWGPNVFVIPEYSFGVRVTEKQLTLSREHRSYQWCDFTRASELVSWDSNRNALWELNVKLQALIA